MYRAPTASLQARERALAIARQTDGVTRVNDELTVGGVSPASRPTRSEVRDLIVAGWITTKIQAQYFADSTVKGRNIDVNTVNGTVTLTGTVDSEAAHQRAIEIARQTEGVRDVQDRLRVQREEPTRASNVERYGETMRERVSDAGITALIQARYFVDDYVKGRDVDVETQDGVVTLKGTVPTETARRHAVELARHTSGVRDVRDELRIQSEAANTSGGRGAMGRLEDGWITTKIEAQFFMDDEIKTRNISVTTVNGEVTLAGEVQSEQAHRRALALARETDGVRRVVDGLRIRRERQPSSQ